MGALKDAFIVALNQFNQGAPYDPLGPLMHDEVIMNEVDFPYCRHCGKVNVINYLNNSQTKQKPKLIVNLNTINEDPNHLVGATYGQVSGTDGLYQDNSVAYEDPPGTNHPISGKIPVRYIFTFILQNNVWLILNATATLLPPRSQS